MPDKFIRRTSGVVLSTIAAMLLLPAAYAQVLDSTLLRRGVEGFDGHAVLRCACLHCLYTIPCLVMQALSELSF